MTTARVELRRVRRTVAAVGTLFGFEEVTLTPKVEGRVVKIACEVGDRVQPGAVLLQIDPTDHQLAVDESQRSLELELAKLGLESVPGPEFAIDTLPSVIRAQLMLENSQKRFDRQRALIAKNVATQEVFEQAETELKVAEANLRQMRLDAQATLAAVRQRQATLEVARLRLAEARVAAPWITALPQLGAGPVDYVVAQRFVSEGEMVRAFPSTPVLELVIDRVLKLRARVPERFSSQIKVGQKVEVRVDAWPDTIFPALVTRLSPTVDARNRTFELEAAVPNPDRRLKAGGFAKADIVVNEVAEATTIPLEALIRFAGVNKVFRVDKGVARETLVELGGHGPGWIEVTRGLAAGDEVATSGVGQLADGRKLAQTPRTEPPRTEPPRTEPPRTEPPRTEPPLVEPQPKTTPRVETPSPADTPPAETPSTPTPPTQTPSTPTPSTETPSSTTPPIDTPSTDTQPANASPTGLSPQGPPAKALAPFESRPKAGDGESAPAATGAAP